MKNFRDNKWFIYGYLPIRVLFSGVALLGAAIYLAGIFGMWFEPRTVKRMWRELK